MIPLAENPAPTKKGLSGRRLLLSMLGVLVLAVVPAVVFPTLMCRPAGEKLDDYGVVPTFSLTDERNLPFSDKEMRGHVTLVNFIFTRCESICPVTSLKMQRLQEKTAMAGSAIKLISFSVDPGFDTPDKLASYAKRFEADPSRWHFVTGPVEAVKSLVEGPMMMSMKQSGVTPSGAPDIAHSGHFLLIDRELRIRGVYDSADLTRMSTMIRHARYLARTSMNEQSSDNSP
jgi:protein SCO1